MLMERTKTETVRRQDGALSFFAIGAGDPPDAARHVEDFVVSAIGRRHPAA
jgi:hypothetical protein